MDIFTNIEEALAFAKAKLLTASVEDADLSAEILLSDVVGLNRQALYSHFEDNLSEAKQKKYKEYIYRRAKHEPIQYILGYAYFRGLKISVGPGVLIPRPETEQLVQRAIDEVAKLDLQSLKILDLCTGSGCIACSLANELRDLKIIATDISKKGIAFARKNVEHNGFSEKIELVNCNMADDVRDIDFDLLITNPPYVPSAVYGSLDKEVIDYEPKLALEAGRDGTSFLDRIISVAKEKLKPGGIVALEFHEDNLGFAKSKFETSGFRECKIYQDLAGKDRILIAYK